MNGCAVCAMKLCDYFQRITKFICLAYNKPHLRAKAIWFVDEANGFSECERYDEFIRIIVEAYDKFNSHSCRF